VKWVKDALFYGTSTSQTDSRTDRLTTYCSVAILRFALRASRGNNCVFRLGDFDEKLLDSQRRNSAMKDLLARRESETEERHATIRRLESELGRVNGELDRVKNEQGQIGEERRRLADELASSKALVAELEQQPEQNESELTRIRLELGQVREERSCLTSDLDRTRRQLIESEGRTRCAMQELNWARSELTRVIGELNDLDGKMNEGRIQQQELTEAKQHSDDLCQSLSTDLENLKVKLTDAESQLAMTRRSKEDLENQLSRSLLNVLVGK